MPSHFDNLEEDVKTNIKIGVLFVFANFQYIWTSLAYSIGRPFRKGFWTNRQFTVALAVTFVCSVWLVFHPDQFTRWLFSLTEWTTPFEVVLVILALLNLILVWTSERFLIVGLLEDPDG